MTSQPARPPRERGGAGLRPGAKGGSGRERRETGMRDEGRETRDEGRGVVGRKGAGQDGRPRLQVPTAWWLPALPRAAAPPPAELLARGRGRSREKGRDWAGAQRRPAPLPLRRLRSRLSLAPAQGELGPALCRPRRRELCWAGGCGTRALPGEAVREACEGLRRNNPLQSTTLFEGSTGYARGLPAQAEVLALAGYRAPLWKRVPNGRDGWAQCR